MTELRRPRGRILGTGSYAPAKIVTNHDLAKTLGTSDEWVFERTGVRTRRVADADETTSDMAAHAARRAIEAAGLTAADIDVIVVGTITGDSPMPACAVHVQRKLGARAVPAFDVAAACAGFVYALVVAEGLVAAGTAKHALVIGVEMLSRVTNWRDRNTCILFGDGAGAVVIGPSDDDRGILASSLYTDGDLADLLVIRAGGTAERLTPEGEIEGRDKIKMAGQEVFKHAVKLLVGSSQAALAKAGLTPDDVDWVVAHQGNQRILASVASRVGVPLERFVLNIAEYGNTSSASIPIALDQAVRDGRIRPGHELLLCALGAGISWGAVVIRY